MKNGFRAFDSDMHVYDAADLYNRYMDPKWGERIPTGRRNGKHGRVEFKLGGGETLRAITDVIATTIQNRSGKLADNVTNNNALLRRLKEKGNVRTISGGKIKKPNATNEPTLPSFIVIPPVVSG